MDNAIFSTIATDSGVKEHTLVIKNTNDYPLKVEKVTPFETEMEGLNYSLQYFTSRWSKEFMPVKVECRTMTLCSSAGRSSAEIHPQFFIMDGEKIVLAIAIAWSGNWRLDIKTTQKGIWISAGINSEGFCKVLEPQEEFHSFRVLTYMPENKTLAEVSRAFAKWYRSYNSIKNNVTEKLPVEWNHWWSYEDYRINEDIFVKNVDVAAELGIEACVLDAGWYGETDLWYHIRGDWHKVNTEKFPSGIRYLSDYVHSKGMLFGIWCEIEALGIKSELAAEKPDFMATAKGEPLNYVCFGNPEAREWAFSTLERLIVDYRADWIKLDFNLDPWLGCDRTDHGHDKGDGLVEHYKGYYEVLDRIRYKYPQVVLENCSSGGLRTDHEILRHTHCTYLSDNDETHNKLRYYSAILKFFPPEVCLHFIWSQSMTDDQGKGPFPLFNVMDQKYTPWELDFYIRAGMLCWMGISHRIKDFDEKAKKLFKKHIDFYKDTVREYIKSAVVYELGEQEFKALKPYYAFQFHLEDSDRSLVFVFNLEKGYREIRLSCLDAEKTYEICNIDSGETVEKGGSGLMHRLSLGEFRDKESVVLIVKPKDL